MRDYAQAIVDAWFDSSRLVHTAYSVICAGMSGTRLVVVMKQDDQYWLREFNTASDVIYMGVPVCRPRTLNNGELEGVMAAYMATVSGGRK